MADQNVLLDLIRKDHSRIADLFKLMIAAPAGDRKRRDLFCDVRREITLHTMLEEEVLYPRMKKETDARRLASAGAAQHAASDRYITMLEKMSTTDPDWIKTAKKLQTIVLEHMAIEEKEIEQVIKRVFTPAELVSLANRLKAMRAA